MHRMKLGQAKVGSISWTDSVRLVTRADTADVPHLFASLDWHRFEVEEPKLDWEHIVVTDGTAIWGLDRTPAGFWAGEERSFVPRELAKRYTHWLPISLPEVSNG